MKKIIATPILILFIVTVSMAQQYIPFQYQSKSKWNFQDKWGLMTADRKTILPPTYYTIAPQIITDEYIFLGKYIIELKTGKQIWDSVESQNLHEIVGNIVKIRMPKRGAVNYQYYSFKNILTKKTIADEGRYSNEKGYVIVEGSGAEGVVDENGKQIITKELYQYIYNFSKDCFIAKNNYNNTVFIYDKKGKKTNTTSYDEIEFNAGRNSFAIGYTLIDKTKGIYEGSFINSKGKTVGTKFYYLSGNKFNNAFFCTSSGFAIKKQSTKIYGKKECTEADKLSETYVVNADGKVIIKKADINNIKEITSGVFSAFNDSTSITTLYDNNGNEILKTSLYTIKDVCGNNLFFAINKVDAKCYFINNKTEKLVNEASFKYDVVRRYMENKGFIIYNRNTNKLIFNIYNALTGKSTGAEQVDLGAGISVDDIAIPLGDYYLVKVIDKNKNQYATYIYDVTGKLIQKSEDGLWMNGNNNTYIKYTLNSKGEKYYIGYYDSKLQPYSIIKD
ncbi:hypothetical protein ACFOWM_07490 [Ferruginibacter yonginensis]|uniref:WG containing repeat-containing protein n=1 Tax=Ferruginibacter yonginensis TaxID=1310416 RepID=A0ABV8QUK1_9BACT